LDKLGKEYEKSFDVIVCRATFSTIDFSEWPVLILKIAELILNKGPKFSEELKELEQAKYKKLLQSTS